eukprot:15364965-Ditylum_brightwellii.AAC.1
MMIISNHMQSFGSLRLLWEGEYCGEGILSAIKPTIWKVSRNALKNAAVTCSATKTMSTSISNQEGDNHNSNVVSELSADVVTADSPDDADDEVKSEDDSSSIGFIGIVGDHTV